MNKSNLCRLKIISCESHVSLRREYTFCRDGRLVNKRLLKTISIHRAFSL